MKLRRIWCLFLLAALMTTGCGGTVGSGGAPSGAPGGPEPSEALRTAASTSPDLSAYAITPFGRAHPSCIHHVPEGGRIHGDGRVTVADQTIFDGSPCVHPLIPSHVTTPAGLSPEPSDGWIEFGWENAVAHNGFSNYNAISAQWVVPETPPTFNFQTIFLFPSLQTCASTFNCSNIIQPVLQYGISEAGGGNFWAVANWYLQGSSVYEASFQNVNPGDTVVGKVLQTDQLEFASNFQVNGGALETLLVGVNAQFNTAQPGVLEAYSVSTCDEYPAGSGVTFDKVTIDQWDTSWSTFFDVSSSVNWTANLLNQGNGPSCAFGVANSNNATNGDVCNLQWGSCLPGSTQSCCPYAGGCYKQGVQTCDSAGSGWGACTGASKTLCNPGAVRACCAFSGGCGCAGNQECNSAGTAWGPCEDSSAKGTHCN